MRRSNFWKFSDVKTKPPRQMGGASTVTLSASSEPKHMTEAVDIGTDEDALRWAEEHDKETAELLRAEEIE